jgi:hypothetical protein
VLSRAFQGESAVFSRASYGQLSRHFKGRVTVNTYKERMLHSTLISSALRVSGINPHVRRGFTGIKIRYLVTT